MRPNSPAQALLWKCWRRSSWQFLLVMVGMLTLLLPLLGFDVVETNIGQRNEVTRAFVYGALFILWATCSGIAYNPRNTIHGIGFVFENDFVRPIATGPLVFIPLIYICLLAAIGYLLPTLLLSAMFGTAPPSVAILFIVLEATLLISAVQWGSPSAWTAWGCWISLILLAWFGWIFPEPLVKDAARAFITPAPQAFIKPLMIVVLALVLLWRSLIRIRSGEVIGRPIDQKFQSPLGKFRAVAFLPALQRSCPTTSPWRATWWREQQVHGFANHIVFGICMALCSLLTIYLLALIGEFDDGFNMPSIISMSLVWFLVICSSTPLAMFDIIFNEQVARISPYSRTRPISTVALLMLKLLVSISSLLIAALSMLFTILIAGPLFIADFYGIIISGWGDLVANWQYSALETFVRGLVLLALCSSLIGIYTALITWLFINFQKIVWYLLAIPAYLLLVFLLLVSLNEPLELEVSVAQVVALHLWPILLGVIAVTGYFLATILRERVLRISQLGILLAGTAFIWVLHLLYLRQESQFAPNSEMVFAVADILQGLLPLFAAALMLWTLHRIRHT